MSLHRDLRPGRPVTAFETEEEVIRLANDNRRLFLHSGPRERSRFSAELEVGMVRMNIGTASIPSAPFDDVKECGPGP